MMISKKQWIRINDALSLLDNSFNIKYNVVKLNVGNTIAHELVKCAKSYELIKNGNIIITEAIFKTGGRADIFDLTNFRVYEVLSSETEEECLKKIEKYPPEIDVVMIVSKEVLKNA